MDIKKRTVALNLLKELEGALKSCSHSNGIVDAQESIEEAIKTLADNNASYKASDYAVVRVHTKLSRLIGFHDLKLTEEAQKCWNEFGDFRFGEAAADLRGVGGPCLG